MFPTNSEWGIQSVWTDSDTRICLHWAVRTHMYPAGGVSPPWIEWLVTRPNVGEKRTEEDPLLEGTLTKHRWEFKTVGHVDLDDIKPGEMFEILETVKLLRRHL